MLVPLVVIDAVLAGFGFACAFGALSYMWARRQRLAMGLFSILSGASGLFALVYVFRSTTTDLDFAFRLSILAMVLVAVIHGVAPFLYRQLTDHRPIWLDYAIGVWAILAGLSALFIPGGSGWNRISAMVPMDAGWLGTVYQPTGERNALFLINLAGSMFVMIYIACLALSAGGRRKTGLLPAVLWPLFFLVFGGHMAGVIIGRWHGPIMPEVVSVGLYLFMGAAILKRERELALEREALLAYHAAGERKLKDILSVFPLGVTWVDPDGKVEFVNPAMKSMFGYTVDDVPTAEAWYEAAYPDPEVRKAAVADWTERLAESVRLGRPGTPGKYLVRCSDGTYKTTEVVGAFIEGTLVAVFSDVTAKEEAESALRESEEKFAKAFRNAPVLIVISDMETGRYIDVNDEVLRVSGFTREEMIGRTSPEIGWIAREVRAELLDPLLEGGRLYGGEAEFSAKGGKGVVGLVSAEQITVAGRECLLTVGVDITKRKEVEESLRDALAKLESAQVAGRVGFWSLDVATMQMELTSGAQRILGVDGDDPATANKQALGRIHPEDREKVLDLDRQLLQPMDKPSVSTIYRIVNKDGNLRYIQHRGFQIIGRDGNVVSLHGSVQDVTELKENEVSLQKLNRELRALSDCGETLLRAENEETLLNEVCRIVCEGAGYRMAWVGMAENDAEKTVRPVAWAGHEEGYLTLAKVSWADTRMGSGPTGTAIRTGRYSYLEDIPGDPRDVPWKSPAAERGYQSMISFPLSDEKGGTFGALTLYSEEVHPFTPDEIRLMEELAGDLAYGLRALRTRTERNRAEAEVRRLNEELELRVAQRTAQLEATNKELEAFSYSVSHDLQAPLRHINGYVYMLKELVEDKLDEEGREIAACIDRSTTRMGVLIDEVLAFSRMSRREMSRGKVDLTALVKGIVDEVEPEVVGRSIEWKVGDLPVVSGDRALLRSVMENLVLNAVKFTRPRNKAVIEVEAETTDTEYVVHVRDNGVGFASESASKLFGVFQRLHRSDEFEGTGIGLANVRRIVNRHGGRTWAEGETDRGATFSFSLPRSEG